MSFQRRICGFANLLGQNNRCGEHAASAASQGRCIFARTKHAEIKCILHSHWEPRRLLVHIVSRKETHMKVDFKDIQEAFEFVSFGEMYTH